ncbi:MAG: hypothetical protein M1821_004835 [Bathelium mastoideum]|nr:MAG: hypothetical protein M1821_004835 [Bathelium mastoideum]
MEGIGEDGGLIRIESRLASLERPISPPPIQKKRGGGPRKTRMHDSRNGDNEHSPAVAEVEAGKAQVSDHLAYFMRYLSKASRSTANLTPRLQIGQFADLYRRNLNSNGHHFIVHQHDHPVAGTHYDLRLQFSESSSLSFAIPYGLPGDPNSRRQLRMAIETRVHNTWNHLVESASHATGSLLIWDVGEYEILPNRLKAVVETDSELSEDGRNVSVQDSNLRSEPAELIEAFQMRRIRLRLQGSKLPHDYTIYLRLPSNSGPLIKKQQRGPRKRARKDMSPPATANYSSEDDRPVFAYRRESEGVVDTNSHDSAGSFHAPDISDEENDEIRVNNAYTGAVNSIGSVHQRRWVVTLDREASGFMKVRKGPEKGRWIPHSSVSKGEKGNSRGDDGENNHAGGWEPFYVRGRDEERSVVTGRLAKEIMDDEGVKGYNGRKMWRPVLE